MTGTTTERRGAARARIAIPIHVSDPSGPQRATVIDISTTGLSCSYPEAVNEMTLMRIGLELGDGSLSQLEGAVVRCEKQRGISPPSYLVAVYFTRVSAEARRAISALVEKHAG